MTRRLIESDGWEKVSIRRLAAEIGIAPTTLYHHVQDKEDLLLLLIGEYAEQLPRPELPAEPRERIVAASIAIHDALSAWTWAAEVLTTDGFVARLGDSARWLVEAIVAGAVEAGCSHAEAVYVFRSIWYYTVGEVLVRARSAREPADLDEFTRRLGSSGLPSLAAVSDQWAGLAARDTYPQGLRALVDGLLAQAGTDS